MKDRKFLAVFPGNRGATATEYGLLIGLLSVVTIVLLVLIGPRVSDVFRTAVAAWNGSAVTPPPAGGGNGNGNGSGGSGVEPPPVPPRVCHEDYHVFDGNFSGLQTYIETNMWRPLGNPSTAVCVFYDDAGLPSPSAPWGFEWNITGSGGNVIAFPNIGFGQKPWREMGVSTAAAPILSRDIQLSYAYSLEDIVGVHNVTASAWITSGDVSTASDVVAEVMIWTERTGSIVPSGEAIEAGISIGGRTYTLWRDTTMSSGSNTWVYYAFVPEGTFRSGTLPIRSFLEHLEDAGHLVASQHLVSVDFGAEVVSGTGVMTVTQASVSNMSGSFTPPPVGAFSFPTRNLAHDFADTRIVSDYVDIPGLDGTPRPFTVTSSDGGGNPQADAGNIVGSAVNASSGLLVFGTNLHVDVPDPGQTRVVTLTVDGVEGTWEIVRAAAPGGGAPTALSPTGGNGNNFFTFQFSDFGLGAGPHPATITATQNGNPVIAQVQGSGGQTQGDLVRIDGTWTNPGSSTVYVLTIAGNSFTWTVSP